MANSFVRRRLAEVAAEAPYHFSARMLAIQGAGDRPVFIPRTVLASEIRTAIEPMRWLLTISSSELTEAHVNALAATYDTCRSRVEALGRYAEKKDRGLLELSADMLTGIRTIDRAARSRSDDVQSLVVAAHDGVVRAHGALMGELEKADPDPENPPGS